MKKILITLLTSMLLLFVACKKKDASATSETEAPSAEDAGKNIYLSTCASCHGPEGKGDGPAGMALNPKPRNFASGTFAYGSDQASVVKTITNGSPKNPAMVAYKNVLKPEEIDAVAKYVISLIGK